jgi:hypothetical protein
LSFSTQFHDPLEPLMTIPQFAKEILRCSRAQGFKLAREGAFPVVRNGQMTRVEPRRALAAYLAKFTVEERKGIQSGKPGRPRKSDPA